MGCANCGAAATSDARFCSQCGAPLSARATPTAPEALWETCEIVLWQGYVTGEFWARAGSGDEAYEVGRSNAFRWWRQRPPDADKADVRAAHEELVSRLRVEGWHPVGEPSAWYAQRFRRGAVSIRPAVEGEPSRQQALRV